MEKKKYLFEELEDYRKEFEHKIKEYIKKEFIPKIYNKHVEISFSNLPYVEQIDFPSENSWIFVYFVEGDKNISFSASYAVYNSKKAQKNDIEIYTKDFDTLEEVLISLTKEVLKQNLKNIFINR